MRRIGVVLNPIAGMGGRVGLKGTDGKVDEARERGATPRAPDRAREALDSLAVATDAVELYTPPGVLGERAAREAGFDPVVVETDESEERIDAPSDLETAIGETTATDTRRAVEAFLDAGVDLVLFVGGDGTAVDVGETIQERDSDVPMLGVPAGVKIYSSVFAVTPRAAGRIAASFTDVTTGEINDIDEDEYRAGEAEVHTELRAIAQTPVAEARQASKQLGGGSVQALGSGFVDELDRETTYVFGPGGTVGAIEDELGIDGTLLGVDVWRDGKRLVADATEAEIRDTLGENNCIVVSPIGGQGFIFGRGNQQLSPPVIEQSDVVVVASRRKLDGLDALRVDTGDYELDEQLRGWHKVRVGRHERRLVKVV